MKEKRYYNQHTNYYAEGNAARQLHELPVYEEEQVRQKPPVKIQRTSKKAKINQSIDFISILVLTAAIGITMFVCTQFLKVQSDVVSMNKEIVRLESTLTKKENENQTLLAQINTALDLNYIYKEAIETLGMVYPKESQIINYESTLSDYVRQYGEIPPITAQSLLEKLFGK